jgi:DNA-binding CsgD family transcriptional regulator
MWLVSTCAVGGNLPFEIKPGEYLIGRSSDQQIVILDSSISRSHARLVVSRQGELRIEDLGSRNGIEVNGVPARCAAIKLHDKIQFGAILCVIAREPFPKEVGPLDAEESTLRRGQARAKQLRLDAALGPAQREVLRLLSQGLSEEEVATAVGRSYHTVHNHVRSIYKHFGVHSRAELLAKLHNDR